MRVIIINSVYGIGSTGKICSAMAHKLKNEGHDVKVVYGRGAKKDDIPFISMQDKVGFFRHIIATRLFDHHGFASQKATARLIKDLDTFNPDLIILHNIHGYYINVEMLFAWIKSRPSVDVEWTLHDCWAFTGHCSHFLISQCNEWKTGCERCINKKSYPKCLGISDSKRNYERKKASFCGVPNMKLITPSKWLADLTRESFLCEYPVTVVHNKIDNSVFHKVPSQFKRNNNIENRYMILGVSNVWSKRKGFDDFISLSKALPESCVIVLVGVSEQQKKKLPANCIGITRTNNQVELAEIYSSADCFFNPTYEDNYPTVNLEAAACGAFIISYDTGGCKETFNSDQGIIVPVGEWHRVCEYLERIPLNE